MSNTNGFHPPSASMECNGQAVEISKRLPSTSSTSSTSSNSTSTNSKKRLKVKLTLPTVNETRSIRANKKKKTSKTVESTRKRLVANDSHHANNGNKKLKPSSLHGRHLGHPILHHPKKTRNQSENIPSTSAPTTNKSDQHFHYNHVVNNDHCDSCGELFGEMISCDKCPATFHLLCANPPLSREDVPKGSYFCENCRTKPVDDEKQSKPTVPPINIDLKIPLQTNGVKKSTGKFSSIEQTKIPKASNGRSLIQPSGEIKFRATKNKTNLKRKRADSSVSPPSTNKSQSVPPVKMADSQLDNLRRLLVSCRPEEFRGPTLPFEDPTFTRDSSIQKNSSTHQTICFVCRKSLNNQRPSIHCDYCPLSYHLDCLTPPMTSLPCSTDKWMCPNHIEPILDRHLFENNRFSTSERVKIYRQYLHIEPRTILQDFVQMRQTKKHLLSKVDAHHRLERIEISRIPNVIEQFYRTARQTPVKIDEDQQEIQPEKSIKSIFVCESSRSNYEPEVWDILQEIINDVADGIKYQYSAVSVKNLIESKTNNEKPVNVLDRIDTLLEALIEPNYVCQQENNRVNGFAALLAAASSCLNDEKVEILAKTTTPNSTADSFSLLIDLSQFALSHAALIHLRSKHVIYIRKHVIWFGSSVSNEISLKKFNDQRTCQFVSDRHACLYYDRRRNTFELLNYSEYGTVVNGLRYGLGNISDEDDDDEEDQENEKYNPTENDQLQKCFCLSSPSYHSAWDGPAQIEQGTVVQIGCHEFLFYRHVVR